MNDDMTTATIILVDDHDDSREIVAAWLRSEGWDVVEFERAEPALEAVLGGHGALVLTDLTLPGMSGSELARRLRDDATTVDIAIVALTGRDNVPFGPGELFDHLIVKPFDPNELLASVARFAAPTTRVSRTVTRPRPVLPGQCIPRTPSSG